MNSEATFGPIQARAEQLFEAEYLAIAKRTDRMFALLMLVQWTAAILLATLFSRYTWAGTEKAVHAHVFAAVFLGGAITSVPVFFAFVRPGERITRFALACGQALWSALLIHLSGGRIETHFHIFGSLAFLAFYRDFTVLLPATVIIAIDHFVRGIYWPESVYGVVNPQWWRTLEHAGWVVFIDFFLIQNCRNARSDLSRLCHRQARLEASEAVIRAASENLEAQVAERTHALESAVEELEWAHTELQQKQWELVQYLQEMPLGVYVVDAAGIPVYANERAEHLLGRGITSDDPNSSDERFVLYTRGTDIPYEEQHPCPMSEALAGRICCTDDIEVHHGDSRRILQVRSAPIWGVGNRVAFGLALYEDVTDKVRAESERLQGQKLESVGQLAAGIAHEINTPMQYIGDNAHFLQSALENVLEMLAFYESVLMEHVGCTDELAASVKRKARELKLDFLKRKIPRAARLTIEGVESVSKIVQAMKEFSHPGSDEKTPLDINKAIETTATVSKNEWKYIADMNLELEPDLPMVPCLPGELNQVVLNLIINGAHAIAETLEEGSGEKGKITIGTCLEGDFAIVSISDSGCGIPEAIRSKVFDPFFTTKEVGRGTGQGLAIARSIMEKHGGTITMKSQVGEGTTFMLLLPLTATEEFQGAA
ncbi:MAG: ATP-binding protein [Myxococcales bacterium]|nr:ATP-binding protein [Myxococcales bacterium]